jgi:hypothetical protein
MLIPSRFRRLPFGLLIASLSAAPLLSAAPGPDAQPDKDELIPNAPASSPGPTAPRFWAAIRQLQSGKPAEVAAGRAALQSLADQEYTHAQVLLGNCLASGSYDFKKDDRKAANLFRLAAERGNAFAKVSLGSCYITGTGVRKDDTKAAQWLNAALAPDADYRQPERPPLAPGETDDRIGAGIAGELRNDPVAEAQATAHFLLGQLLTKKNQLAEAHPHYLAAAQAGTDGTSGLYAAATQAALNYAFGRGVPRDTAKATAMLEHSRRLNARQRVSLLRNYVSLKMVDEFAVADLEEKASEAGANEEAGLQLTIAAQFSDRKSKDYNAAEAAKWYELAAENGQVWAMLQLGLMHARGELGRPDPEKAFAWFERAGGGSKPKHFLGVANLAICYQQGFGTPKDTARAAALFAKHRDLDIVCYLGSINQCPSAPVTFEEAVALNETWAWKKNDAHAQYLLALRHLNGWGVNADRAAAQKLLKRAAKTGHGGALCLLGLFEERESIQPLPGGGFKCDDDKLKRAVDYYRRGAEAGNVDAMANYANMLANGTGVARDIAKSEALYLRCLSLDPEHARSHCNLAVHYAARLHEIRDTIDGEGIARYRALMLKHYEEAIRLESPYAARNLGDIYYEGLLLPRDYAKAYLHYEQAAEWGLPSVHFQLGKMHEYGQGVPVTLTEAAYHYRLAALEGHEVALLRLANFYLTGLGVTRDLDRAAFWIGRLAQHGHVRVLTIYAEILIRKGDYSTVIPLLRKLIEEKDSYVAGYGYYRLSYCYLNGLGVKADATRAKRYQAQALALGNGTALTELALQQLKQGQTQQGLANLLLAADQSTEASYMLGNFYFFGTYVEPDRDRGLRYMRRAAEGNHMQALYFLAALAYNKEKGAPNLEEAIRFARQAESAGHPQATFVREKLEQRRKNTEAPPEEDTRARTL